MGAKEYSIAFAIAGRLAGDFANTFKTANSAVQSLNQKINDLNKQAASVDGVVKLRQETIKLAETSNNQRKSLEAVRMSLQRSKSPTVEQLQLERTLSTQYEKTKRALDKKRGALKAAEMSAGTNGTALKELIARNEKLAKATEQARKAQVKLADIQARAQKATTLQNNIKSNAWAGASSLAYMASVATGPISIPVKAAIDMEDAMAEINKVIDFDTPDGLKNLQKQLEEMSLRIPMTADGLAKIAAAAGQSGIAAKDLTSFTEQAAKMAVAFDITAEEAGEMMSKWQSGMGLSLEKTYRLADATNFLSNQNAALASQIGSVLKRYGAMGAVAGLTETQTAAFAASVISSGAGAEEAATGIKAFMRAMGKGGSMSEVQKAAFRNAGLDPKEMQKKLQKDAPATIIEALEAIQKKIPKEKWNQYLSVMFGEEAAVAVGPMMKNLDGLKKNFAMVADEANYSGSMLKEFESRSATTSNSLVLAQNAAYYAARALGEAMLEPLKGGASMFVGFAQSVGNLIKENQELVSFFVKVATASGLAVASFHVLRIGIFAVVSPILSVCKAYQSFQRTLLLANLALASGEKLTIAQRVVLLANAAATKVATVAKKAWAMALDGSLLALIKEKSALWANKIAVHAQTAAVKIATLAQKAWAVALVVGPLIAQKAVLLAHKAATLAHVMTIKGAAIAQKAWAAALFFGPLVAQKVAVLALEAATLAHVATVNGAAIAQKAWLATLAIGPVVAQKAALIALQGAMLAWKGVCMVVTVAQKALNFVLMANPIGLVITAVGGLVAAGVALYQNWDAIKEKVKELWEWISNFFGKIAETISGTWDKVKSFFGFGSKETTVNVASAQKAQQTAQQSANSTGKRISLNTPEEDKRITALAVLASLQLENANGDWDKMAQARRALEERRLGGTSIEEVQRLIQAEEAIKAQRVAAFNQKSARMRQEFEQRRSRMEQMFIQPPAAVPAMASGGIVTSPTLALVGEGRESEAVLPLSKLDGLLGRNGSTSNSVNVNLTVNVSGASQDAYAEVKRGIAEGSASLKRELERLLNDQRRLSYV